MRSFEAYVDPVLNETILKHRLACGLEIYLLVKAGFSKKYAYFGTRFGAFFNNLKVGNEDVNLPLGIAHFLEHKIFEDKEKNIFDAFSELGASVNAYTNYSATVYHFSTIEHFETCLEKLLQFVQHLHLTDENVEKEKGIILQEIAAYEDDPGYLALVNLLKNLYVSHPVREDIAGTAESVRSTTKAALEHAYETFYVPENMVLFIAGDLDPEKTMDVIEASLDEEYKKRKSEFELVMPFEPEAIVGKRIEIEMTIPAPMFEMAFKHQPLPYGVQETLKRTMAQKVFMDAQFGRGSVFYNRLYEEGIFNSTISVDFTQGLDYAYSIFGGETHRVEEAIAAFHDEIDRILDEGPDIEAFERIRRKLIGKFISASNSLQYLSNAFMHYYMKGHHLFDYLKTIHEIRAEDAYEAFKSLHEKPHEVISIVNPKGDKNIESSSI
jgi:predicted Zn-dependent peptidase